MDVTQNPLRFFLQLEADGKVEPGSMLDELLLYYRWTKCHCCVIIDEEKNRVPLELNYVQKLLLSRAMQQAYEGKPVRLISLKARKQGVSTWIQSLITFRTSTYANRLAVTIAHEGKATNDIFSIAKTMASSAPVPPGRQRPFAGQRLISWTDTNSFYSCHTAGGLAVGAGSTPSDLHLSEAAKWPLPRGLETDYNATNAVPDNNKNSLILYESTAYGRNWFWKKFSDGLLSENPYDSVFTPWFVDLRRTIDTDDVVTPTSAERDLIHLARSEYGLSLTHGQLLWRRAKIESLTGGEPVFRQEYPSTPEEAVAGTKGLVLSSLRRAIVASLPFVPARLEERDLVGGVDFGYYDPTVIISAAVYDGRCFVYRVYRRKAGIARQHAKACYDGTTYYCDPSALTGRNELKAACRDEGTHCRFVPAPRVKKAGDPDVIRSEWCRLADALDTGHLLILSDESEQLQYEADNLMWNEDTGQPDQHRTAEGHFDTLDALRYLWLGVSKILNHRNVDILRDMHVSHAEVSERRQLRVI